MSERALNAAPIDPVELAAELIRRPSVTPKDEGALDIVAARLERLGFTCHRLVFADPGPSGEPAEPIVNLYARLGSGRPNLCFAGHTDVVPTGPEEGWSVEPFAASLRNGELCGRGAVDMKGAIASFIAAAERFLAARGDNFTGSISLLITGDEEAAAINGTRKVLDWLRQRGEALDACVVGEPTSAAALGDMIKIGRRGSITGRLVVEGVQGHVAYPHLVDNAAHRLVALLHALTTTSLDDGTEHFQPSSLQVTTIDIGNPTTNIAPGVARATFNIRFNDQWSSASLKEWVERRLAAVGGKCRLSWEVSGESFLVPPGPVSDCLAAAIGAVTGRAPELSTTGGTSDARFIHAYCPVAEFGLVGQTMHKADERVDIADLSQLTAIYEAFLDRFFRSRMTVSPWTEVQLAVGGALRLALGDRRGLGFFDVSLDGFWRSFRAAAICYPMYLFLLATRVTSAQWEAAGWPTVIFVETIAYVIAWVAFPLLMLHIAHWLGRDQRFLAFMVAYNWSQVPQTVLLTIIGLDTATGLLPPQIVQFAEAIATIAVLVYEWYIARVALAVSGPQAALVVVIDVVLGTTLGRVAQGLH